MLSKNRRAWLMLQLLPSALLVGCATNSVKPMCELPRLPPPPSESTPQPQTSYLEIAASDIQSWQSELMATPLMQGLAGQLGQQTIYKSCGNKCGDGGE